MSAVTLPGLTPTRNRKRYSVRLPKRLWIVPWRTKNGDSQVYSNASKKKADLFIQVAQKQGLLVAKKAAQYTRGGD